MKGHIRERSPGQWAIVLDTPIRKPASGSAAGIHSEARSDRLGSNAPG